MSIVGGPSRFAAPSDGSPPDLDITWSSFPGGWRGIVFSGPWADTCELEFGDGCRLWPLHKIPGSLVEVFELPSVTTRSVHYVGDLEEVLDRMDTCYEVPPKPYPYTMAETHVWVTISYP